MRSRDKRERIFYNFITNCKLLLAFILFGQFRFRIRLRSLKHCSLIPAVFGHIYYIDNYTYNHETDYRADECGEYDIYASFR